MNKEYKCIKCDKEPTAYWMGLLVCDECGKTATFTNMKKYIKKCQKK